MALIISNNSKLAFLSRLLDNTSTSETKIQADMEEMLSVANKANYTILDSLYNQIADGTDMLGELMVEVRRTTAQIAEGLAESKAVEAALRPKFREIADQATAKAFKGVVACQRRRGEPGESNYDTVKDAGSVQELLGSMDTERRKYITAIFEDFTANKTEDIEGAYRKIGDAVETTCNSYDALIVGLSDYAKDLGIDISKLQEKYDYAASIQASAVKSAQPLDDAPVF